MRVYSVAICKQDGSWACSVSLKDIWDSLGSRHPVPEPIGCALVGDGYCGWPHEVLWCVKIEIHLSVAK